MHCFLLGRKAAFKINDPLNAAAWEKIIQENPFFTSVFYDAVLQHVGRIEFLVETLRSGTMPICDMFIVIEAQGAGNYLSGSA